MRVGVRRKSGPHPLLPKQSPRGLTSKAEVPIIEAETALFPIVLSQMEKSAYLP